jgi:hypothetical protein
MSGLSRYIVDAVVLERRSPTALAREHGITRRWIHKLLKRFLEISGAAAALSFAGFVGEAGADAWKGLKALIVKLYQARARSSAPRGVELLTGPSP